MNENEQIAELQKLKDRVSLEFDNIQEYLYEKQKQIYGYIDSVIYKLEDEKNVMLQAQAKEYEGINLHRRRGDRRRPV